MRLFFFDGGVKKRGSFDGRKDDDRGEGGVPIWPGPAFGRLQDV